MRKILPISIILLPLLMFMSCNSSSDKKLELKGTEIVLDFQDCEDSMAILEMFDFNQMLLLDEQVLINGKAMMKTELSKDAAYQLRVGLLKIPFVFDGKTITFSGSCKDFNSINVIGSRSTKNLFGFIKNVEILNENIGKQKTEYDSLIKFNLVDSIVTAKKLNIENQISEMNNYIKLYIDSVNHFQLALYALNYLNPVSELTFFEKFTNSIEKRFPKNFIADSFATLFKNSIENTNKRGVKVGEMAPDFTLLNIDGKSISLSSTRGKYVYLDFWASFCSPCKTENKNKLKIVREFSNSNFQMISVSLDENEHKWKNAIIKDSLHWTHLVEPLSWNSKLTEMYNLDKIPTNYLIDPDGKVISKNMSIEDLENQLKTLLNVKSISNIE